MSEKENGGKSNGHCYKSGNQEELDVHISFFDIETPDDPSMEIVLPKADVAAFISKAMTGQPLHLQVEGGLVTIPLEAYNGKSIVTRSATKEDLEE